MGASGAAHPPWAQKEEVLDLCKETKMSTPIAKKGPAAPNPGGSARSPPPSKVAPGLGRLSALCPPAGQTNLPKMVKFDVAEEESRGDVDGFDPEAPPAKSKSFASKSLGESEKTGIQVRARPPPRARAVEPPAFPPSSGRRWRRRGRAPGPGAGPGASGAAVLRRNAPPRGRAPPAGARVSEP